jgi:hypothetical protein
LVGWIKIQSQTKNPRMLKQKEEKKSAFDKAFKNKHGLGLQEQS